MRCSWWMFVLLAMSFLSMIGCAPGDDDDDSADDDVVIDDDAGDDDAADDDAVIDDDAGDDDVADDDAADDDAADDDAGDDDTGSTQLLMIGWGDDAKLTSFLWVNDKWVETPFPVDMYDGTGCTPGPSAFVGGQKGYMTCNHWFEGSVWMPGPAYIYMLTLSYEWMIYTREKAWHLLGSPAPSGVMNNAAIVSAPALDSLWAVSFYEYDETDHGLPGYHYAYSGFIFGYDGLDPYPDWGGADNHVTALFMISPSQGIAAADINTDEHRLLIKDEAYGWHQQDLPAGLTGGQFVWFWMTDPDNGYAIWSSDSSAEHAVAEARDGTWTKLTPPAGCESMMPTRVWVQGDYAIAIAAGSTFDNRFWERRGEQWTCRRVGEQFGAASLDDAIVMADGTTYISGQWLNGEGRLLVRLTADGYEEMTPPILSGTRLHAVGPGAPTQSQYYSMVE